MKPMHGPEGGAVESSVETAIQRARGRGQALDEPVRSSMESAFGADFGGVRIHTDGEADGLNRSLNARAFTAGNDVFFRSGEYNPGSSGGQTLLAHELTHTVQQGAAPVQRQPAPVQRNGDDDEDEAIDPEALIRFLLLYMVLSGDTFDDTNWPGLTDEAVEGVGEMFSQAEKEAFAASAGERETAEAQEFAGTGTAYWNPSWGKLEGMLEQKQHLGALEGDPTETLKGAKNARKGDMRPFSFNEDLLTVFQEVNEKKTSLLATEGFATKAGARATKEAQGVKQAEEDKEQAKSAMALMLWARTAAGNDPDLARRFTEIYRAMPGEAIQTYLESKAQDDGRITFLHQHRTDFGPQFSEEVFEAFYTHPTEVGVVKKLLELPVSPWTVLALESILKTGKAKTDLARLIKLLKLCVDKVWSFVDADALVKGLAKKALEAVVDTADLQNRIVELASAGWTFVVLAEVIRKFYAKKADAAVLAAFLKVCKEHSFSGDNVKTLVTKLRAAILEGIANTNALHEPLKAVADAWNDYEKLAQTLEAFYAKQPDFAIMAKFLKGCKDRPWTQPEAKDLVDGLTQDPLTEVAEQEELQKKIKAVSVVWTDYKKIAAVLQEAHDKSVPLDDKKEFLEICKTKTYTADNAKKFITTSSTAPGYTWTQRLDQVKKFYTHTQPAGGTNDMGGTQYGLHLLNLPRHYHSHNRPRYNSRLRVILPQNKWTHVKDGHSYNDFWFDYGNCHRYGGISSMFAPGTDIKAKASAASGALVAEMANAVWGGGTQNTSNANYVIAYRNIGLDNSSVPWVYKVGISQFYPDGAWVHHKLEGDLAEGIGQLKGLIP